MTTSNIVYKMEMVAQKVEDEEMSLNKAAIIIRACNTQLRALQMIITSNTRLKFKRIPMRTKIRMQMR